MTQQGTGLQGPSTAASGGTITVQVSTGDSSITVNTGGPDESTFPVPADGAVTFPVPNVPAGTIVAVVAGRGLTASIIYIEVVAPGP
jgi:hypothetical protein